MLNHQINLEVPLTFLRVVTNRNNDLIEQLQAAQYNVFMAFGEWIERAWE
jgi:hypothetical protein